MMLQLPNWAWIISRALIWLSARTVTRCWFPFASLRSLDQPLRPVQLRHQCDSYACLIPVISTLSRDLCARRSWPGYAQRT
jgi:hypothetical protein